MRVIVYGGNGSLGKCCVETFLKKNYWVLSIGHSKNSNATENITVENNLSWTQEEEYVRRQAKILLLDEKVDAIICVAGGWAGGGIKTKNMIKNADLMWRQSVFTSTISSVLAYEYLKENGLLILSAAKSALTATPGMIGYGIAKAAIIQLTKSLSNDNSNMPKDSITATLMPDVLDTAANRSGIPNGDFKSWTPLYFISDAIVDWMNGINLPKNGELVEFITKNGETDIKYF